MVDEIFVFGDQIYIESAPVAFNGSKSPSQIF